MATEILKSFGTLQSELEQAKSSLKGVDENIKRLIGRDPSELIAPGQRHVKRPHTVNNEDNANKHRWGLGGNRRVYTHENDEPPTKRRGGVFNRLSDRVNDRVSYQDEDDDVKGYKQMISKIIVTPKEVPSRQDALDAQSGDEQFKARNRRMFGALLGTLQKFQQEETKLKPKEEKRAQLEKKIEEHEIREKAEIKKERQELFLNRKKKQAEIKMIEQKMQKMKAYAQWEDLQKSRMNFILTKSKPCIHYLPKRLNEPNKIALEETKKNIQKMIDERKQEVFSELKVIEDKLNWNFKNKDVVMNESDKESDADHNEDEEGKENELDTCMGVKEENSRQMDTSEAAFSEDKDVATDINHQTYNESSKSIIKTESNQEQN